MSGTWRKHQRAARRVYESSAWRCIVALAITFDFVSRWWTFSKLKRDLFSSDSEELCSVPIKSLHFFWRAAVWWTPSTFQKMVQQSPTRWTWCSRFSRDTCIEMYLVAHKRDGLSIGLSFRAPMRYSLKLLLIGLQILDIFFALELLFAGTRNQIAFIADIYRQGWVANTGCCSILQLADAMGSPLYWERMELVPCCYCRLLGNTFSLTQLHSYDWIFWPFPWQLSTLFMPSLSPYTRIRMIRIFHVARSYFLRIQPLFSYIYIYIYIYMDWFLLLYAAVYSMFKAFVSFKIIMTALRQG